MDFRKEDEKTHNDKTDLVTPLQSSTSISNLNPNGLSTSSSSQEALNPAGLSFSASTWGQEDVNTDQNNSVIRGEVTQDNNDSNNSQEGLLLRDSLDTGVINDLGGNIYVRNLDENESTSSLSFSLSSPLSSPLSPSPTEETTPMKDKKFAHSFKSPKFKFSHNFTPTSSTSASTKNDTVSSSTKNDDNTTSSSIKNGGNTTNSSNRDKSLNVDKQEEQSSEITDSVTTIENIDNSTSNQTNVNDSNTAKELEETPSLSPTPFLPSVSLTSLSSLELVLNHTPVHTPTLQLYEEQKPYTDELNSRKISTNSNNSNNSNDSIDSNDSSSDSLKPLFTSINPNTLTSSSSSSFPSSLPSTPILYSHKDREEKLNEEQLTETITIDTKSKLKFVHKFNTKPNFRKENSEKHKIPKVEGDEEIAQNKDQEEKEDQEEHLFHSDNEREDEEGKSTSDSESQEKAEKRKFRHAFRRGNADLGPDLDSSHPNYELLKKLKEEMNDLIEEEEHALTLQKLALAELEEEEEGDSSKKDIVRSIIFRIVLCAFAILLMWLCSLPVLLALVNNVVPHPDTSNVIDDWKSLLDTSAKEEAAHRSCTQFHYAQCEAQMEANKKEFDMALLNVYAGKELDLEYSRGNLTTCSDPYNALTEAFSTHQRLNGTIVYWDDPQRCSKKDIKMLNSLFGVESYKFMDRFKQKLEMYSDFAAKAMQELDETAAERLEYDKNYIEKKLGTLSLQIEPLRNVDVSEIKRLLDDAKNFLKKARQINCFGQQFTECPFDIYRTLSMNIQNMRVRFKEIQDLMKFMKSAATFLGDQYQLTKKEVNRLLAELVAIKEFFDHFPGLNFMQGYVVVPYPDVKTFFPKMPDINFEIPSINFKPIEDMMKAAQEEMFQRAEMALEAILEPFRQTHLNFEPLKLQFLDEVPTLFENYDPPPLVFSSEEEVEMVRVEMPELINKEVVKGIVNTTKTKFKDAVSLGTAAFEKINITHYISSAKNIVTAPDFSVGAADVKTASMDVKATVDTASSFITLFVVLDIVYRSFTTLRTLMIYLAKSAAELPILDITLPEESEESVSILSSMPIYLIGPIVVAIFVVIFVVFGLIIIVNFYLTLYDAYIDNCVKTDKGTSTAETVTDIVHGLLHGKNKVTTYSEEVEFSAKLTAVCSDSNIDFVSNMFDYNKQLISDRISFETMSEMMGTIDRCVHLSTFDSEYNSLIAENNLPGMKFFEIQDILFNQCALSNVAHVAPWNNTTQILLDDLRNSCLSKMPKCVSSCIPIDEALISDMGRDATCNSEFMLHSLIIRAILLIMVLVCLQISRIMIMSFITNFFFKQLGDDVLQVTAEIDIDGYHTPVIPEEERVKLIDDIIWKHKLVALIKLAIGVLIHIPYIIFITQISSFERPLQ